MQGIAIISSISTHPDDFIHCLVQFHHIGLIAGLSSREDLSIDEKVVLATLQFSLSLLEDAVEC